MRELTNQDTNQVAGGFGPAVLFTSTVVRLLVTSGGTAVSYWLRSELKNKES